MKPEEIRDFIKKELEKQLSNQSVRALHQSQFVPKMIKQRHLEDKIIKFGVVANLPTNDTTGVSAYFATDTNTLYLFNGTAWVSEVLS